MRNHTDLLALKPERTQAVVSQLEYLLKAHGDEEARRDQCSLRDIVTGLRDVADDLGPDFGAALAGSDEVVVAPATMSAFDPCI